MRPNIDISHTLNGRVKDYAKQQNMALDEVYREIIEAGLEAVEHPDES
jgi:predicted DNA-binding protein